jgi:23S rRNA (cytosine1962-C5)-methyltransferase
MDARIRPVRTNPPPEQAAMLHEASIDSHAQVATVEKRMQGRDHPVLVGVPETHYLKCFILRKVE